MAGLRICVVGAGAMGGLLGGRLAAAGEQVSLIARGSHLAAMRAKLLMRFMCLLLCGFAA